MKIPESFVIPNTRTTNGGAPALQAFLNMGNLQELPPHSSGPRGEEESILHAIKDAGYDGVQGGNPTLARKVGLSYAAGGRVNTPQEVLPSARKAADEGAVCQTLHVAWGLESDDEMDRLAEAILAASSSTGLPLYVETHRATATQDMYRTVQWVKRYPGLRINGDFSHWYTGQEMVYGGFDMKLAFIEPVLDRVRFIHGRIGNPGSMQVRVIDREEAAHMGHFKALWRRSFEGFLRSAAPGDAFIFCPELLYTKNFYARAFPGPDGAMMEESDRWAEALRYVAIARECFHEAGKAVRD